MTFDGDLDEQDMHALDLDDRPVDVAMNLRSRHISEEQMHKFEGDVAAIFEAFGLDLNTPATKRTPQRFLRVAVARTAV